MTRFCIECRFFKNHPVFGNSCFNPKASGTSLVTGEPIGSPAAYQRHEGRCGKAGKLFEARQPSLGSEATAEDLRRIFLQ